MKYAEKDSIDLPNKLLPFIWKYLKNKKLYLVAFSIIALIWAVNISLGPYLLKIIIDSVVQYPQDNSKMLSFVLMPATLYVALSIVTNITFRAHDYLNLKLSPFIKSSISVDMFSYLINHSYEFFQNNFAGSLTRKISDMAVNVESFINIVKNAILPRLLAIIISTGTLFVVVSPIFGIILFTWTVAFVFLSYVVAKRSESLARELSEDATKMDGVMSDSLSNAISTKLFSNTRGEISYLTKFMDKLVASDRNLLWENLKANFMHGCFVTILIGAMMAALIYDRIYGSVSPGDFALVLMLSLSYIMGLEDVRQHMMEFSKVIGRCNQALSIIRIPHAICDSLNAIPINVKKGQIEFKNVSFNYENNIPLYKNLNVVIHPGQKVGLVGYSGGGKSTFIKLILRLIDVQSGTILIDEQNIKDVTAYSLRKGIGTIPQEPDLFHRTIMENIRFAKPEASDNEVKEAAVSASCHEFISELPEQYNTLVGERGIKLSGGQKQRIAIARAFLKNAPILLLDEATSSHYAKHF